MTKSKKVTNFFHPIKALKKKTHSKISKKGKLINCLFINNNYNY